MNATTVGQERSVQVVGINIQYWEGGAGEPLVVLLGEHEFELDVDQPST